MNTTFRRFHPFTGDSMPCRSTLAWGSVLLLGALAGCSGPHTTTDKRTYDGLSRQSTALLREALDGFDDFVKHTADRTVIDLGQKIPSKEHRERIGSWRKRFIEECRTATEQDDPVTGLLDVWMLSRRALNHFESDESRAVLGEQGPIVLQAAKRVYDRIERIARRYLTEAAFGRMSQAVAEYAGTHPIPGTFADERSFSATHAGEAFLRGVWALLRAPLRTADELLQIPFALPGLVQGLDRASDVVEGFPKEARKQLEYLADDLEGRETVRKAVDSFERFSKISESLTQALGEEPKTAEEGAEGVDRLPPEWRATVVEVRETAQSIEHTVERVPKTAEALEALAEAIGRAAKEIGQAAKEIGTLRSTPDGRGEPAPPESKEPFRFQDATESAEAWTQTAAQSRGLVQEFRNLMESDSFDGIGKKMRGVITHAALWVVLLMALLFVLMLLYRGITNRRRPARSAP